MKKLFLLLSLFFLGIFGASGQVDAKGAMIILEDSYVEFILESAATAGDENPYGTTPGETLGFLSTAVEFGLINTSTTSLLVEYEEAFNGYQLLPGGVGLKPLDSIVNTTAGILSYYDASDSMLNLINFNNGTSPSRVKISAPGGQEISSIFPNINDLFFIRSTGENPYNPTFTVVDNRTSEPEPNQSDLISGIGLTFSNITDNTTLLISGVIGVFFAGILAIFLLPILIRYVRSYIEGGTR